MARRVSLLASYIVPAAVAWALLGLLLHLLPLRSTALVLIAVYGVSYGLLESTGRARPSPPGSGWQVPSAWVRGVSARRRMWVWGALLGPGLATRNPYAGFGLLVLATAAVGSLRASLLVAVAIGVAHAFGRAAGLLRDVAMIGTGNYMQAVVASMYWRVFDGYALLVIGGLAVVTCLRVL
jgi:hypothetical protein